MQIFLDDQDYLRFIGFLGDVVEKFEIECWNYCVMPNHYHATLRPAKPNFSEAMRKLNGNYAQWRNRRHRRVGHAFQGRFKDQIVDTDEYLLVLSRYIALNPVRAGLTQTPDQWRWSSYAATIGLQPAPPFLSIGPVLGQFGSEEPEILRKRFADYVEGQNEDQAADDRIRSNVRILGNKAFRRRIEGRG